MDFGIFHKLLFLLSFFIATNNAILNLITILPQFDYYDRRGNIHVTCNTTGITDNVGMYFQYQDKNYTVPRISNIPGVYIGNFTAVTTDQTKVMIVCENLNNGRLLGAKIYVLGYPPSIIPQHYNVDLSCRDYNLHRMVCCISPNMSAIEQLLGFELNRNGLFQTKLFFSDSDTEVVSSKNSCYELTNYVAGPTVSLYIVIQNVLGNIRYNFTFDRKSIQKPNEPKLKITERDRTSFLFSVDMTDFGNYKVTAICDSVSPLRTSRIMVFEIIGMFSKPLQFGNWSQNAHISCQFRAQTILGYETIGSPSDQSSIVVTLLEGAPNMGPFVSPLLVDYSVYNRGVLSGLTVYFTDLALIDRNGVITGYKWKCEQCFVNKSNVSGLVHHLPAFSRSISLNNASVGSNMSITACTADGCSQTWTTFRFEQLLEDDAIRRLSIIRDSVDPYNVTIIWHDKPLKIGSQRLLVCSLTSTETQCSSIETINLMDASRIQLRIDDDRQWRFALLSPGYNHKLKWTTCFYNYLLSHQETKEQLQTFNAYRHITRRMECNLEMCEVFYDITIPSCKELPDIYFDELYVSYRASSDSTVLRIPVASRNIVSFSLTNLTTGRYSYVATISVRTLFNKTVVWFEDVHITDFWCIRNVILIIVAGIVFMVIVVLILWCMKNRIKEKYFKKVFTKPCDIIMKNNIHTPMKLLNTDNPLCHQVVLPSSDMLDKDSMTSREKESTSNTSICSADLSNHNIEEGLISLKVTEPMPYTCRPKTVGYQYSHIAVPTNKANNNDTTGAE